MATPAVCEIDECGILAVGRCRHCGRPFCASHHHRRHMQITGTAIQYDETVPDICNVCPAEAQARKAEEDRVRRVELERLRKEAPEELHGAEFFNADGHRMLLRRAGARRFRVQRVKMTWVPKRTLFGERGDLVPEYEEVGWAWPIGSLPIEEHRYSGTVQVGTAQVALFDVDPPLMFATPALAMGQLNVHRAAWEIPDGSPFRGDADVRLRTDLTRIEALVRAAGAEALDSR